ncbi:hypothetical protein B9G69_015030 [Bdellovibrio sp. SKB1291214]|uniref:hypothetical protein n=1 Tax=Bdellovibrio sp. SKB1291214 TaxID=1732569 RepID=UPI000B519368|nr:hypothetical protein [Bdellovibrio sp. SKB1291214]UYL08354.1 hypothetical protein B9G69_015030 [Bdellovibrio sp. SKB1291214]
MSRHNKGKGFSQTSKRYDGNLKEQRRASHNKQMDHSSDIHGEESLNSENSSSEKNRSLNK